jgi:asparagine synthase (glutamine-hydrolysing)
MRHIGLLASDPAAVRAFLEAVTQTGSASGAPCVLREAAPAPRVAVVAWPGPGDEPASATGADGSFVLVAGELYNRDALREVLGHEGTGAVDDASLVLALYRGGGPQALARVDAAATITIWDAAAGVLRLYRDRWGQVSQLYAERPGRLTWASDLRGLLDLGAETTLDADALDFFLAAGYFPAPWTGLAAVRKLAPAHVLTARPGGSVDVRPCWRPTGRPKLESAGEPTTDRLQALLEQSLHRRLRPGARTGVLLSGGVDSALLAGMLTRRLDLELDTFTFEYGHYQGVFNEGRLAEATARHFGTRHQAIAFTPRDLAEHLDRMVLAYEEPFTWGLHSYFLRDVAARGVTTLMSGAGVGDWYAGRKDALARRLRPWPAPFRAVARVLEALPTGGQRRGLARDVLLAAATGLPDKTNETVATDLLRRRLYQDPGRARGRHRIRTEMQPVVEALREEDDQDQVALLTQRYFIAECNLHWYARWSRAWGVRVAHPYYDNDLQAFVLRLRRPDRNKPEMRRLAERFMPHAMAHAPKLAHTVPIRDWFRGPLLDLLRSRLEPGRLARNGVFDARAVHRLIDEHAAGAANREWLLWAILTTTVWQDVVLAGAAAAPRLLTGVVACR